MLILLGIDKCGVPESGYTVQTMLLYFHNLDYEQNFHKIFRCIIIVDQNS